MTLLQPWFLLALLGLAIPVALHFVGKQQKRRISLPSLFLFQYEISQRQRRIRLDALLLLLARLLLWTALVLLFAQLMCNSTLESDEEPSDKVVLVMDTSLSMAATREGRPLLEWARDRALSVLASLPDEAWVMVLTLHDSKAAFQDKAGARRTLEALDSAALSSEPMVLNRLPEEASEIHVFSAFTDATFGSRLLATRTPVRAWIIRSEPRGQWQLQDLESPFPVRFLDTSLPLRVVLDEIGPAGSTDWQLSGRLGDDDTSEWQPLLTTNAEDGLWRGNMMLPSPGLWQIRLEIQDPIYPLDNEAKFQVTVLESLSVAVLGATALHRELARAIMGSPAQIETRIETAGLAAADLAVIVGLSSVSASDREILRQRAVAGRPTLVLATNENAAAWKAWLGSLGLSDRSTVSDVAPVDRRGLVSEDAILGNGLSKLLFNKDYRQHATASGEGVDTWLAGDFPVISSWTDAALAVMWSGIDPDNPFWTEPAFIVVAHRAMMKTVALGVGREATRIPDANSRFHGQFADRSEVQIRELFPGSNEVSFPSFVASPPPVKAPGANNPWAEDSLWLLILMMGSLLLLGEWILAQVRSHF